MKHRKPFRSFDTYELECLVLTVALAVLVMLWVWRF